MAILDRSRFIHKPPTSITANKQAAGNQAKSVAAWFIKAMCINSSLDVAQSTTYDYAINA